MSIRKKKPSRNADVITEEIPAPGSPVTGVGLRSFVEGPMREQAERAAKVL
jgi:hypothetical protein